MLVNDSFVIHNIAFIKYEMTLSKIEIVGGICDLVRTPTMHYPEEAFIIYINYLKNFFSLNVS
ncbi:hypothetical protein [Candidatus Nitrosocosmicus sp. R]